jgi:hypothetical protein
VALLLGAGIRAHHARQQPDAGIEQQDGPGLPAREDEVAGRDLQHVPRLDDALVHALIAAAEDHGAGP